MGILVLILSIVAYITSWIPIIGIPVSLGCSIVAIVIAAKKVKGLRGKQTAIYIISTFISSFAILMLVFVSGVVAVLEYDEKSYSTERSALEAKVKTFKEYDRKDEIIINNEYLVDVSELDIDGEAHHVWMEVEGLKDYAYYSMYDFALYDAVRDELFYPAYVSGNDTFRFGRLDEGDKEKALIEYIVPGDCERELYLVYVDNENGVKIKL